MNGQRKALIVANDQYENEGLRRLLSPAADADALERVLGDPQIGGFDVQVVTDRPDSIMDTYRTLRPNGSSGDRRDNHR